MKKKDLLERLRSYGFSKRIIEAFAVVRREDFVPQSEKECAYIDEALPIGHGATISQPYTIGFMLALLDVKPGQKVLEVGSGSGYVLALLSELVQEGEIYGIEIIHELAEQSKKALNGRKNVKNHPLKQVACHVVLEHAREPFSPKRAHKGSRHVKVVEGSGWAGLPEKAPFDRILVSAAATKKPYHLIEQLKAGGILIVPVGNTIVQIKKVNGKVEEKDFPGFVFVPLREK